MFNMFKKAHRLVIKLQYMGDNKYCIEGTIPVEVINDLDIDGFNGFRIITIKRLGSRNIRSFRVNMIDKRKKLKNKKGLRGIILQKVNYGPIIRK